MNVKGRRTRVLLAAMLVCAMLLAACGSGGGEKQPAGNNAANDKQATGESSADLIEIQFARPVDATFKYAEGDDLENNIWTRAYEQELGIKIGYAWTAAAAQYDERMNVTIASGDLPDMFVVNKSQLKQLVDSGQIEDLTQVWESHASEVSRDLFSQDGGRALQSATFDGKLYAIPDLQSHTDSLNVLWIRTDWLEALQLAEPQNMGDVLAIAESFATQDPDNNGVRDTYGMAIHKALWGNWAALEGFFNSYNAYPEIWVEDGSGKLVYGSVQPEVKTALGKLQELYSQGIIDPEFGVKDASQLAESVAKIGLFYGPQWAPIFPLQAAKEQNPDMEWKPFAIVNEEGTGASSQAIFPVNQYTVVRKGYEHPEAVVKLNNLFNEKMWSENNEVNTYGTTEEGLEQFKNAVVQSWPAYKNQEGQVLIAEALEKGDPSGLNTEHTRLYNNIVAYHNGDIAYWSWEKVFGPVSSQHILNHYMENDLIQNEQFFGAPTATMASKKSSLDKMTLEMFTKIIMGDSTLDEFDKYVENWMALGGRDITNEVNEWYAAQ